jgi:hypothetical protein
MHICKTISAMVMMNISSVALHVLQATFWPSVCGMFACMATFRFGMAEEVHSVLQRCLHVFLSEQESLLRVQHV